MLRSTCLLVVLYVDIAAIAQESISQRPNTWIQHPQAKIEGRRYETPLGYAPELKKSLVLGGRSSWADYKKPHSFDQLAFDPKTSDWENWFPEGADWGPKFGHVSAPPWKDEKWEFTDSAGNTRPNWTTYGTFSLGHAYDYDPDTKTFLFFAHGKTFRYDPAARTWTDLKPKSDPERELGGILLWSSMCYEREQKQFVLFGGGNVQTDRGDPGTWVYSPEHNTWTDLKLVKQPPQRANSQLVYDPVNKKVVLFGGDQLHQLLADTWTFDLAKKEWEQVKTPRSPSPRAGHALLWLPKAKKALLLAGYEYTSNTGYVANMYKPLSFEAWTLDIAKGEWNLLRRYETIEAPVGPANGMLHAAVDENDVVLTTSNGIAFRCPIDASKIDVEGTEKFAAKSTDVQRRIGPYDPAWFTQDVPAVDPEQVVKDLANLPANEWVLRPTPKLPRPNMDWGSAVFIPSQDKIVRFSGGHSAYSGTAPVVYDVKTDRYSLPFAPEMPIEFIYSNDQVNGEWSFQKNPWMTGHTYKATGHDPSSQSLVFAAHDYTYFFDARTSKWSRNEEKCPFAPNMYHVTLATTKHGCIAWADKRGGGAGLWKLSGSSRTWEALPLTGTLPNQSPDRHGMAYDANRNRLLFFSTVDKQKGDVMAYDFATGKAEWLKAKGREKAAVSSRETIYLPELDAVLIGARFNETDKQPLWALYDCTANAWFGLELTGADPIGKGSFNNSLGLMYDPARMLVWAVGQNSHVHVLRIDPKTLKRVPLE